MCLAAVCEIGFDIEELCQGITDAWDANPDGAGYAYALNGSIKSAKGFKTAESFCNRIRTLKADGSLDNSALLVHLRYTSAGEKSAANCHPFRAGDYYMIHNGTVSRYASDKVRSDTSILADVIGKLPSDHVYNDGYIELIEEMLGMSKIALIGRDGVAHVYNQELWDYTSPKKILYSNQYWTGMKRVGHETSPKSKNTIDFDAYDEKDWRLYAGMSC